MNEEKFKWKCDICGTRFNNFQAEGFNRKIYCPLCFFKELNKQNEQQLQAYKDKEDKLREYILENTYENEYNIDLCTHDNKLLEPIKDILNEGGK